MDLENWAYRKKEGERAERTYAEARPFESEKGTPAGNADITEYQSDEYSKKEGMRSPALFFVLSGGTTREKNYLKSFEKQVYRSLRLIFLSSDKGRGGLTPKQMMNLWMTIYQEGVVTVVRQRDPFACQRRV
ncbi:MAG: hypothetical protein LBN29_01840 [Mediterranea sp.]|jgi:hypothetical protein|nr:hypothetical protein [Mediterranea sp.]